jgi:hypothetical protein
MEQLDRWKWFEKLITLRLAEKISEGTVFTNEELTADSSLVGAYIFVHPKTKEVYIGSTKNLYERKYKHFWHIERGDHRNVKVNKAYSENKTDKIYFFTWITNDLEKAKDLEQKFLDSYFDNPKCLNIAPDARLSGKNVKRSKELRERISLRVKENWKDPNYRALKSRLAKEYANKPSVRKALKERSIEAINRPGAKEHLRNKANEQWNDPEARLKKSEEVKRYFSNPENRLKAKLARKHLLKNISVDGKIFKGREAVANHYNITPAAVGGRILSKHKPTWFYVN